MPEKITGLDDLRRRIDEVDNNLHDLLMERARVVLEIARHKKRGQPAFRPEREASIIRRLVARHQGALPAAALVRLWRTIIAAHTQMQAPFKVALYGGELDLFDLARGHFGAAPIERYDSPGQLLGAISAGAGRVVGVTAWPAADGHVWWPGLASADEARPRIVARLPFCHDPAGGSAGHGAIVLAACDPGDSGDDTSFLVLLTETEISRARLTEKLAAIGFAGRAIDSRQRGSEGGEALHLFEVAGYLAAGDDRLARLVQDSGGDIAVAWPIGGYANPILLPGA